MNALVLAPFLGLLFVLLACAGRVVLSEKDPARRADAYRVFKLLAGTGGIAGVLLKLHEMGVF